MRLVTTLLLATVALPTAASAAVHGYQSLAMSAHGDEVASVEGAGQGAHGAIVVRSARDGRVLRTIDPCAKCAYSGLTFGPDGSIAFVSRDRTKPDG